MSCSRQNFDITKKWGRKHFWRYFKKDLFDKWAWRYMLQDTFGRYLCILIGHKPFENDEGYMFCARCSRSLAKRLTTRHRQTSG